MSESDVSPWGVVYSTAQLYSRKFGRPNDDGYLLEVARGIGLHYGSAARGRYVFVNAGRASWTRFEVAIRERYRFILYAYKDCVRIWPFQVDQYSDPGLDVTMGTDAVTAFERLIADGTAVEKNTPEQLDATGTVPPAYISEGANVDFPEDWDI